MATLKQIAEKAGVSIASVSRVLKQDESFSISIDTKKRIFEAAQELQYTAQELKPQQLKKISIENVKKVAIIMLYEEITEVIDSYYLTIRVHAKDQLIKNDIKVTEFYCGENSDNPSLIGFDGVLIIGSRASWSMNKVLQVELKNCDLPLVFTDFEPEKKELAWDIVCNDLLQVTNMALQHFFEEQHLKIGYIGSVYQARDKIIQDDRFIAFKRALTDKALFNPSYVKQGFKVSAESGYKMAEEMIKSNDMPRALLIENDTIALGVLHALNDYNIKVGEDISVISCNDIPALSYTNPPLSSVRLHSDFLGVMAARCMYNRLQEPRTMGIKTLINSELILRKSSMIRSETK